MLSDLRWCGRGIIQSYLSPAARGLFCFSLTIKLPKPLHARINYCLIRYKHAPVQLVPALKSLVSKQWHWQVQFTQLVCSTFGWENGHAGTNAGSCLFRATDRVMRTRFTFVSENPFPPSCLSLRPPAGFGRRWAPLFGVPDCDAALVTSRGAEGTADPRYSPRMRGAPVGYCLFFTFFHG